MKMKLKHVKYNDVMWHEVWYFFSGIRIKTVHPMISLILLNAQMYVYQGALTILFFCIFGLFCFTLISVVLKDSKSIFVHTNNDSNLSGR